MEDNNFELVPHISSYMTSKGTKMTTKSLTLRACHGFATGDFYECTEILKKREEMSLDSRKYQILQNGSYSHLHKTPYCAIK